MPKPTTATSLPKLYARTRWSAEDARRFLASWRSEEMSLSAFARQHGVRPRRLYLWRNKLRQAIPPPPITFKEISLPHSTIETAGALEVVLRSGVKVRVGPTFDQVALRRLLEVLATVSA